MATHTLTATAGRTNARYAVAAGFLGWTIDAFDFLVLVFPVSAIASGVCDLAFDGSRKVL